MPDNTKMPDNITDNFSFEQVQQLEIIKKTVLKKILSKQASERLARLKLVKPEIAAQLENYLVQLYNSGKIRSEITEEQIRMILETISTKREFKISKVHK